MISVSSCPNSVAQTYDSWKVFKGADINYRSAMSTLLFTVAVVTQRVIDIRSCHGFLVDLESVLLPG